MQILTEIFNLEGVAVHGCTVETERILVRISSKKRTIHCSKCGSAFSKKGVKHATGTLRLYQHGTLDSKQVIIVARRNRYRCPNCKTTITEPLGKVVLGSGYSRTKNYDDQILQKLAFSPNISSVAKDFDITDDKVRTILRDNTQKGPWLNQNLDKLSDESVLGIDEKHWLKKQYHLVITSITDKLLVALGPNRKKITVLILLSMILEKITPKAVCIDMWMAYRNAVREIFGDKVPVIVDKFHVFSFVNRHILASKDILEFDREKRGLEICTLPSFRTLLLSKRNFSKSPNAKKRA